MPRGKSGKVGQKQLSTLSLDVTLCRLRVFLIYSTELFCHKVSNLCPGRSSFSFSPACCITSAWRQRLNLIFYEMNEDRLESISFPFLFLSGRWPPTSRGGIPSWDDGCSATFQCSSVSSNFFRLPVLIRILDLANILVAQSHFGRFTSISSSVSDPVVKGKPCCW